MVVEDEQLAIAKGSIWDARSLNGEYLRVALNQVELLTMSMHKGNTSFIEDGLEMLRNYLQDNLTHVEILAGDAKKDYLDFREAIKKRESDKKHA
ncbi:hypothetical protein MMG00_14010 [Ignatzschineria rhizosphaerae]|uniref:Uncharacterized protein n=1 Tax=Ignatzschineria rhizosphaerae TaxID=2923279 RepID=A0ABY3X6C0_9GAMM|nr:hypothetical protein [Ignatzschineria rhizosphaerae]UNM96286.1 hypothetical protein MMG00_14010 [Ignatzschineria rhizosphaerae]